MTGRSDLAGLDLSPKERRFVSALVRTGDSYAAALDSGYSPGDAHSAAWELPRNARVAAAIAVHTRAAIVSGAAVAARYLVAAVKDDKVPHGVRVQAANSLLDRAGIVAPRDGARPGARDLDACSIEELHDMVDALARRRADQARMIDATPQQHGSAGAGASDTDIFG